MLLQIRKVHKAYGALKVIRGMDLDVAQGEFVGVIGPNGAGKTSAFGLIAGHLRPDSGSILLNGQDVTPWTADARCRAGIARTFQVPQPFAGLSVYENALVAASFGAAMHGRAAAHAAREALSRCGLLPLGDAPAGMLTLVQRKRLELARALASRPRLLLLDEVGGGLTDAEIQQLVDLVGEIHASGVTVLWIEHQVHALMSIARRLVVLTEGEVLADGEPREVIASRVVRETYLGSELEMEAGVGHVAG